MQTVTVAETIAQTNQKFMSAIRRKDADAASRCYTTDAAVLAPQAETVSGRKAIQNFWNGLIKMGVTAVEMHTTELVEVGETAYEVGRYRVLAGEKELDRGKYVVIWRMEEGEWKLHRDIWNTSISA